MKFKMLVEIIDVDMLDGARDRYSVSVGLRHVDYPQNEDHIIWSSPAEKPEDTIICYCGFQVAADSDKLDEAMRELLFAQPETSREVDGITLIR